jgi:hypothetical protein
MAHSRQGHFQIRTPAFLAHLPEKFADECDFFTNGNKPKGGDTVRPHVSFVVSCALAQLDSMSSYERRMFLKRGALRILGEEVRLDVPGRIRVRLIRTDTIRPLDLEAA